MKSKKTLLAIVSGGLIVVGSIIWTVFDPYYGSIGGLLIIIGGIAFLGLLLSLIVGAVKEK